MKIITTIMAFEVLTTASLALAKGAKKEIKARIVCKTKTTRLKKGNSVFLEKNGANIQVVPEDYNAVKISICEKMPSKETTPLSFKVKEAGIVTIIVDERSKTRMESDGWVFVDKGEWGWGGGKSREYIILKKYLEPGKHQIPHGTVYEFGTRLVFD